MLVARIDDVDEPLRNVRDHSQRDHPRADLVQRDAANHGKLTGARPAIRCFLVVPARIAGRELQLTC